MKNFVKSMKHIENSFIPMCIGVMIFVVLNLCMPHHDVAIVNKSNYTLKTYHEEPFKITTTKTEFDSLGIQFIFSTGSIQQWKDSNKKICVKSLVFPRRFAIYSNCYFIWEGNRTCTFIAQKQKYPGYKFLLLGDKSDVNHVYSIFTTREMYIVY